jgi:hypothetical protein
VFVALRPVRLGLARGLLYVRVTPAKGEPSHEIVLVRLKRNDRAEDWMPYVEKSLAEAIKPEAREQIEAMAPAFC